jgi:hypothetical protein
MEDRMSRTTLCAMAALGLHGCWGGGQCDADCIAALTLVFTDGRVPGDVTLSSTGWSLVIPCADLLDTAETSESYDGMWSFSCGPGSAYVDTTDFVWPEPLTVSEGADSWAIGPDWVHDGVCGSQCTLGSATLD